MATKVRSWPAHWRAPAVMCGALVAGVLLAAGHDIFYNSLRGREVSGRDVYVGSWKASSQQINTAAGTAFAFLVKASLVLASGIAYTQLFFRTVATQTNSLSKLDRWFSGLDDVVSLLCLTTYWKHALLTLVAVTVWLLPVAAIIAPASLSVTFSQLPDSPVSPLAVPQPALDSLAFLSGHTYNTSLTDFAQITSFDPDQEVLRVASAAAASGSILPIEAPGVNASWQITLDAPKVVCEDMDDEFRTQLKANLLDGLNPGITSLGEPQDFQSMFSYLAWTTWTNTTTDPDRTEADHTVRLPFASGSSGELDLHPQPRTAGSEFYIAVFPQASTLPPHSVWGETSSTSNGAFGVEAMDWYFDNATLLQCHQAASKYVIRFAFDGPNQEQHVDVVSATDVERSWTNDPNDLQIFDKYNLRGKSVDAIWTTVMSLIVGASNAAAPRLGAAELMSFSPNTSGLFTKEYATQVFFTSLADTVELAAIIPAQVSISDMWPSSKPTPFAADSLLSPNHAEASGKKHLKDALEELLFNVTISMASSKKLLYNESSPFAPPLVDVTFNLYGNVYHYDSAKLWLPYGLAIGVTVLNVIIGFIAMLRTGASYTANFSTAVRFAKNGDLLGATTEESSLPGKDPLPAPLARARFAIRSGPNSENHEMQNSGQTKNYSQISQSEEWDSGRQPST